MSLCLLAAEQYDGLVAHFGVVRATRSPVVRGVVLLRYDTWR